MGGALTRTGSPIEIISNVLNIASIAVIAFNWAKDDNTGNTDNTKSLLFVYTQHAIETVCTTCDRAEIFGICRRKLRIMQTGYLIRGYLNLGKPAIGGV